MKDLKELLNYNKETGTFTWNVSRGKGKRGNDVGWLRQNGYISTKIMGHHAHRDSHTGILGVSFDKRLLSKPWQASIQVNKKKKNLGRYSTPEEAYNVYLKAKRDLHEGCTM